MPPGASPSRHDQAGRKALHVLPANFSFLLRKPFKSTSPRRAIGQRLSGIHSQLCQIIAQLIQGIHFDCVHAEFGRAFEVEGAVVDETAFFCWNLGYVEREAVDPFLWLTQADEAGTEEHTEDLAECEYLHPVIVEFARFVVDGAHQVLA